MYFGLFCLIIGAFVMTKTKAKASRALTTGSEVYQSINWSIELFEANLLGLVGGLFLKYIVSPMQASILAFLLVILAIAVMVFGIIAMYNINETVFKTYRYFLTEVTKRFYSTMAISTFFWFIIYYFF